MMRWLYAGGLLWGTACQHHPLKPPVTPPLAPCPAQTLTSIEAAALGRKGATTVDVNRLGEHHSTASLEAGIPMLKKAALHGDVQAMSRYASLVTWYGFIDNDGEPFLGRSQMENAQEGLLFTILAAHRGREITVGEEETFRVLLDPTVQFPEGFLDDASGTAWVFQGWPAETVDQVRKQAYRWRDCWAE